MNRTSFLSRLSDGLSGLPQQEIDDIIADYAMHFSEGAAAGRSEDDVAAALGDPTRLAKELRAESGLRRWEERRNAGNFFHAIFALIGLATLDLFFLLPVLFCVGLFVFILGVVLFALCIVGLALIVSMLGFGSGMFSRAFTGAGLVASGVAGGAVLLLILEWLVHALGRYARLHYRLLSPSK